MEYTHALEVIATLCIAKKYPMRCSWSACSWSMLATFWSSALVKMTKRQSTSSVANIVARMPTVSPKSVSSASSTHSIPQWRRQNKFAMRSVQLPNTSRPIAWAPPTTVAFRLSAATSSQNMVARQTLPVTLPCAKSWHELKVPSLPH